MSRPQPVHELRSHIQELSMPILTEDVAHDVAAFSLFSWPPNPALTAVQLSARGVLLLNNIIGIGLCFAAGARPYQSPIYFVGGSFMAASLLLVPFMLLWNSRLFRTSVHRNQGGSEQLEHNTVKGTDRKSAPTGILRLAALIDCGGLLSFLIIYPVMVLDAQHSRRSYYRSNKVLFSYATVTCLVSL